MTIKLCRIVIHMQMEILIVHHRLQVMIVGHTHWHRVRIGLTQECLGVEGDISLLVLIPVNWCLIVGKRHAITVVDGILVTVEQLPSVGQHLVKTRVDAGRLQS